MARPKRKTPKGKPSAIKSDPALPAALEKLVDSKLVQRIYGDGLAKPVKRASIVASEVVDEVGGIALDVLKGLRLFTAPFVLAAQYRTRVLSDLEACRQRVPEERQVESPPEIAGPILERIRFLTDDNLLRQRYLNLLTMSIDAENQSQVHPSFVTILNQLSRDEVVILEGIESHTHFIEDFYSEDPYGTKRAGAALSAYMCPAEAEGLEWCVDLAIPRRIDLYLDHLKSLCLICFGDKRKFERRDDNWCSAWIDSTPVSLSELGKLFTAVCSPETQLAAMVRNRTKRCAKISENPCF